jgi:hypothetical protein
VEQQHLQHRTGWQLAEAEGKDLIMAKFISSFLRILDSFINAE